MPEEKKIVLIDVLIRYHAEVDTSCEEHNTPATLSGYLDRIQTMLCSTSESESEEDPDVLKEDMEIVESDIRYALPIPKEGVRYAWVGRPEPQRYRVRQTVTVEVEVMATDQQEAAQVAKYIDANFEYDLVPESLQAPDDHGGFIPEKTYGKVSVQKLSE